MKHLLSNIGGILCSMLLFSTASRSQSSPDVKFDHISLKDGLSNFTITSIVQDKQGFLWFGTEDGLNKFDGNTFDHFIYSPSDTTGLPSPKINALCVDKTNRIWIATRVGLVIHDPYSGSLRRKQVSKGTGDEVLSLFEDPNGTMWIGTTTGVFRYSPENDSIIHEKQFGLVKIRCFAEDSSGALWVGTTANGVRRYDKTNNRLTKFERTRSDTTLLSSNEITALTVDTRGTVWIGTSQGICTFEIGSQQFHKRFGFPIIPIDEGIVDILSDHKGNIWIGTARVGLVKYDPLQKTFFRFGHEAENPHSLDKSRIQRLFEDDGNILWVSTYRGGLNRYDPDRDYFVNIRPSTRAGSGLSAGQVYAICEDRNKEVWIGTIGGGLNRYNPVTGKFTYYRMLRKNAPTIQSDDSLAAPSEAILSLYEDSFGTMWIGAADALYRYNRQKDSFEHFITPRPEGGVRLQGNVKCIGEDAVGNIWIGTHGGGVHRFEAATKTFITYRNDPANPKSLSGNIVWAICKDSRGVLWFGTFGAGISRYNPATNDFTRINGAQPSSGPSSVYCITEGPDSALWIGTFAGGMHRLDPLTLQLSSFLKKDGLPNNFVKAILPDNHGALWLATDLGLSRFDMFTKTFRNYTKEDGLHDNVFLSGAYHRGKSGRLYVGGENGLTMFSPDSIQENSHVPPIVLTRVQVFDRPYRDRGMPWLTEGVTVNYNENFLQFEFAALDYANPSRHRYEYIMEGFDRDWIQSGQRRYARYTNLPPGTYTFRVKGSNNHNVWNDKGTAVTVTVTPPFWARWWFRVLAAIVAIGVLVIAYNFRVNKLLELERLRVRIASDLHDDIGSSLTRISLQSELIKEEIEPEERDRYLSNIAATSRDLVSTMSDIVWSIDARNDTWGSLLDKMKGSAVTMLSMKGIELNFAHSGFDIKKKLPTDLRENLYLICKESVNNIAKHSTAHNVSITLRNDHDKCTMIISDDGQGMSEQLLAAAQSGMSMGKSGHGFRNMRMRAERFGATIEWVNDHGLKLILTMKPV
jgi:ligand-binding sensor domain-containing protein/two-component sensor histidine kinase